MVYTWRRKNLEGGYMLKRNKGAAKRSAALLIASALILTPVASVFASKDISKETALDTEAFDTLVAGGEIADDEDISSNNWACAIKDAGVLRIGGTETSFLFSQLDETDGRIRGFDAGLFQLLTRYILGDESSFEITLVDSGTRESVLKNDQVDAVFATYSITDARKKEVSFAGPYYTSQQAILVQERNTEINSIDDLSGKIVAVQAGSTGPDILADYNNADMDIQEFATDREARTALKLGLVDAYVTDYTLMLNAIVKSPNDYKIAGEQFGPVDSYGVGLPLDSDGVEFINTFLKNVIENGTWKKLWQITLGDRTGIDTAPESPVIPDAE